MDQSTTKRCCHCGETKPLNTFGKNRSTPDGYQKWCRECRHTHSADPIRHAQKIASDRDRYREKRSDILAKSRAARRERAANRPPKPHYDKRAHDREYARQRSADPIRREQRRQWFRDKYNNDPAFRQRMIESRQRYEQNNPNSKIMARRKSHNRRAKIKSIGGSFTNEEWTMLCAKYDHHCLCCGEKKPLTIDHIVSIDSGGSNDISNIQPLCFACNRRKGTRTIDYRCEV